MGWVALATVGMQAASAIMQGQAAKEQAEAEAAVAEAQAQIEENEAKQIAARGALEQRRFAEEQARGQSLMKARIGLTGAVATEGAPLLAQAEQQTENELDRLIQSYNITEAIKAKQYEAEVSRFRAKMAKKKGKAAATAAYFKAGSGLVLSGFENDWFGSSVQSSARRSGVSSAGASTAIGRTTSGGYIFG